LFFLLLYGKSSLVFHLFLAHAISMHPTWTTDTLILRRTRILREVIGDIGSCTGIQVSRGMEIAPQIDMLQINRSTLNGCPWFVPRLPPALAASASSQKTQAF
jgi:hypothetical protein